jgi:1,4-alpha-glucan branching enzyme
VSDPLAQICSHSRLIRRFGHSAQPPNCPKKDDRLLSKDATGYWTAFQAGAQDGDQYQFWVAGTGSNGYKRDPYARELAAAGFPNCFCILRAADAYPWHDAGFRTPDFSEMVIYQAHIGTYAISTSGLASNFLDVAAKIPYLAALGINVLQPLPVDEQEANPGMGYGGADLFSPDFPYVASTTSLPAYLTTINSLLAAKQIAPLALDHIQSGPSQLKALVDLCHVFGIAVAFDVVYNQCGRLQRERSARRQLPLLLRPSAKRRKQQRQPLFYQPGPGHRWPCLRDVERGCVPAAARQRPALHYGIPRGRVPLDEISILLSTNQANGWQFCRDLTSALRGLQPRVLQNAEFWPGEFPDIPSTVQPVISSAPAGGAGFDVVQHDMLRSALRNAVGAASGGAQAAVSLSAVAGALYPPGLDHAWRAVTCVENHDLVMAGRSPRIPALADGSNHRSWYARSHSRFATAILLTAPGIPQLFMGQEFLEDKPWDVDPNGPDLLWWAGLTSGSDRAMVDHLRFTQDAIHLRAAQPALRGDAVHPYYVSNSDRVLAFHRWREETGEDMIVVGTLAEGTWWNYQLGFPSGGFWREVFNSDVYDNWVNPWVAGNGAGVQANGGPMHGLAASASIVIPANGVVVFAKS